MKFLRRNLQRDKNDKRSEKQGRPGEIAPVQGHRDGIAARLAKRRRGDLDDPEDKRDSGHLARRQRRACLCHSFGGLRNRMLRHEIHRRAKHI